MQTSLEPSGGRSLTRRCFLVLGMHRSGTSSVAGTLVRIGVTPPKTLLGGNKANERGHWESSALIAFHDEMLASAASRWDDWRPFNAAWYNTPVAANFKERGKRLLAEEFGNASDFVFKDPRICRFSKFWLDIFAEEGIEARVLLPLRSPLEVAQSHRSRDGFPLRKGLLLWIRHVLEAETGSRQLPRALFEWSTFLNDWRHSVEQVGLALGIQWPCLTDVTAAEVDRFLSPNLKHERVSEEDLDDHPELHTWIMSAYSALKQLCRNPGDKLAQMEIDSLRKRFDEAADLFGDALADTELAHLEATRALQLEREHSGRLSQEHEDRLAQEVEAHENSRRAVEAERDRLSTLLQNTEERTLHAEKLLQTEKDIKDHLIKEVTGKLAREREIYERTTRVLTVERDLFERQLLSATERAEHIGADLAAMASTVKEQNAAIDTLRSAHEALAAQYERLMRSKSWRWTAPTRSLLSWLKTSRQRAGVQATGIGKVGLRGIASGAERVPPQLRQLLPAAIRNPLRQVLFPSARAETRRVESTSIHTAPTESMMLERIAQLSYPAKRGPTLVFVSHDANRGGAPVVLASIAAWFQRHTDFDIRIICMTGGPMFSVFERIAPTIVLGSMTIPRDKLVAYRNVVLDFVGGNWKYSFINTVAAGDFVDLVSPGVKTFAFLHEMEKIIAAFEPQFDKICGKAIQIFCASSAVRDAILARAPALSEVAVVRESFIARPKIQGFRSTESKLARRLEMGIPAEHRLVVGCGTVHWRKQPDVFLRLAKAMIASHQNVTFLWIGDGEDLDKMRLEANAVDPDRLRFVGHKDNVSEYLEAADVFVLPSLEDPFPLVCLEAAAASVPSVIFREAGGMKSFVEPNGEDPAGVAVTLGDEAAMLAAINHLIADESLRERLARVGYERVTERYLADAACADILASMQEISGSNPRVSVVVPNYNCGPYIEQRLQSVADQTYRDYEVILLDDHSTDGSLDLLYRAAKGRKNWRVYPAEVNSGTPFRAWKRGVDIARGDLIWIAEADDFCEPDFLSRMLAAFDVTGTRLAHGRSVPVSSEGEVAGDYNDLYLNRVAEDRWTASHHFPAKLAVSFGLGRANTIPNASGVLVSREAAQFAIDVAVDFTLAGDWAFYLAAAFGGRIAYVHDAVNYHRRHGTTVTSSIEGSRAYFQEFADVHQVVEFFYGKDSVRDAAALAFVDAEKTRFGTRVDVVGQLPSALKRPKPITVLYGVGDLSGGGAQMFALRLVAGLQQHGQRSLLFTCDHEPDHPAVASQLSASVPRLAAADVDQAGLPQICNDWGVDLIITGHWWADRAVAGWLDNTSHPVPWIVVMHGCHENVLSHKNAFSDFDNVMKAMERNVTHWVWTAPKNRQIFERGIVKPKSSSHIVNGFRPDQAPSNSRAEFGLSENAIVFTLASRAIEEKGWLVAIEAFEEVKRKLGKERDAALLLVGDGPVMDRLASSGVRAGIQLIRHTNRLDEIIAVSDVCLLPSWFAGESLPLTLIEFLAQGKPAIVSDIGMCPWAIDADADPAGIVLLRDAEGKVTAKDLAAAMVGAICDRPLWQRYERNAEHAFKKFDFDKMIQGYLSLSYSILAPQTALQDIAAEEAVTPMELSS